MCKNEFDYYRKIQKPHPLFIEYGIDAVPFKHKDLNKVLWECGPGLATAAIQSNCIQELITFIAPKILGGENSMNPFDDFEFKEMHETIKVSYSQFSLIGNDICVKSSFNN